MRRSSEPSRSSRSPATAPPSAPADPSLVDGQASFHRLLHAAGVGMWWWDLRTDEVWFSPEWKHQLGFEDHEIAPLLDEWLSRLHPNDRAPTLEAAAEFRTGRRPRYDLEFRLKDKGGAWRWIWSRAELVRDAQGNPVRLQGGHVDITERKLAELALRQSEERLQLAHEATLDGLWDWDIPTGKVFYSQQWARLLGFEPDEIPPRVEAFFDVLHPDDRARVQVVLEAHLRGETPVKQDEVRLRTKAGTYRWFLDRGKVIRRDATGTPLRMVGTITDITDNKNLEQQFLRAQRMESIGTLAGGIAHDFNNVLGPIVMSLEMLKRRLPDPDSQELLELIAASSRAGTGMVQRLLSFARGFEGQRVEVQPRSVVQDIARLATDTFLGAITVRTDLAPELGTISADPSQLHQVLLNLAVNARDAMPEGGTLTLGAHDLTLTSGEVGHHGAIPPGSYVVLHVADTGTGIPAPVLERIFDPFFTTKDIGKGTGLGLSTTLAIVKSHGGHLRVLSEPGRGTEFQIYLPTVPSPAPLPTAPGSTEVLAGHDELILVADDDRSMRRTAAFMLQGHGYRVLLASDGAEAVAHLLAHRKEVAAAIIDMMMPTMGGAATMRALLETRPDLPMIATSGLCTAQNIETATAAGARQFIAKPYSAEGMLALLASVLPVHAEDLPMKSSGGETSAH